MLAEWQEYDRLEPFGQWRDNWHMAVMASLFANANRDPKKRREPFTPADFFFVDPQTRKEQSDAQTVAMFEMLAKAGNGRSS